MNFVAVTSCPTGIAHSQMAAENLEQVAADDGHDIKVEIQGAMGVENELSADDVANADAVVIAADTSVNRDRFEGKPLVKGTVKDAVNDAEGMLEDAIDAAESEAEAVPADGAGETDDASSVTTEDEAQPQRRGGDRSKGLVARLKRLFS